MTNIDLYCLSPQGFSSSILRMDKMRLTVMPVALRPEGEASTTSMAVAALKHPSGWISTSVEDAGRVILQARELLASVLPPDIDRDPDLKDQSHRLESLGVEYSSGSPNLMFTAVLPIAATELGGSDSVWAALPTKRGDAILESEGPASTALVRYWRGQLVRTTAAFDFLPEFFTVSQVRSVYSSVWGEEQQDANFQRWLLSAKSADSRPILAEEDSEVVQRSTQAAFVDRMARALGAEPSSVASNWDAKYIGVSAGVAALGVGMKAIPAAVVAGAIVGSLVSWQRTRGAGRPPAWFRRTTPRRVELQAWYPVRPTFGSPVSLD